MYPLLKRFLFRLDPEKAHHLTFKALKFWFAVPGVKSFIKGKYAVDHPSLERKLFGLTFKNPVGLAAGMDKNAQLVDEFAHLGFGFVEIGTVTPRPQAGNPRKRLFRLLEDEAIINRMGFNNEGVEAAVRQLNRRKSDVIVGGNIGKNKVTPNDKAIDDYLICFNTMYDVVDYFVVNVSSPNTPNLRDLQEKEPLTRLLNTLQAENGKKRKRKPILLKIAPDLTEPQLLDIIAIVKDTKIDGVIATNTTISRENLRSDQKSEPGGLSGKPLRARATEVIRFLSEKSDRAFPIIGVGGIHSADDAMEKLEAGADLVQIYTGFVYEGPKLIKAINQRLIKK